MVVMCLLLLDDRIIHCSSAISEEEREGNMPCFTVRFSVSVGWIYLLINAGAKCVHILLRQFLERQCAREEQRKYNRDIYI
jgi:hypothetical protein